MVSDGIIVQKDVKEEKEEYNDDDSINSGNNESNRQERIKAARAKKHKKLERQASVERGKVERNFDVGKRGHSLASIRTKQKEAGKVMIHATVQYMNLRKKLLILLCSFSGLLQELIENRLITADRQSQLMDLLIETAPIPAAELAQKYEVQYGIRATTLQAGPEFRELDSFFIKGIYRIDYKPLPLAHKEILTALLTEDCYAIDYNKAEPILAEKSIKMSP